jgi:FkbM family methyltransferase
MKYENAPGKSESIKLLQRIYENKAINAIRKIDKPFVIYGAGNLGKMAIEYFKIIGKSPVLIIDKLYDNTFTNNTFENIKISSLDNVSFEIRQRSLIIITIVNSSYIEILNFLLSKGYKDIVHFYDVTEAYKDIHPLSNGWILSNFDNNDFEKTSDVLTIWNDDVSRAHHLQFIAWHRLREEWVFNNSVIDVNNRYFTSEVNNILNDDEALLDVGAHKGEVSQKFIINVNNKYKKIWMIEPDTINYSEIINNLNFKNEIRLKKIEIINRAVSDNNFNEIFYDGLGYSSQFSKFGNKNINVVTIDQLKLSPSFIKMHLEGWELGALKGAINTILTNKPIMAITCYHNSLGVWQIPLWLMNLKFDDSTFYKYSFRLHGWCGTGGVVYCIPTR